MTTNQNFSEITGYISVIEAARRLGVDPKRVYTFIEQGRLSILKVAHATFVSEASIEQFQLKSTTGRPRTKASPWRESPGDGTFLITTITVRICADQREKFVERLREMRKQ